MSLVLDKIKGSMLLLPITSVRFYSNPIISNDTITGYTNDLTILYPEQESSYLFTKLGNKNSKGTYVNYGWNFELTVYVPNNNFYKDTTEAQLNGLGYDMLVELKKLMNYGSCLLDLRLGNVPDGSQSLVDETLPMGDQEAPTNINFSLLRKIIIKNGSIGYDVEHTEIRPRTKITYNAFITDLTNSDEIEYTGTEYVDNEEPEETT